MNTNDSFLEVFTSLGDHWEMEDKKKLALEEFVCQLYSSNLIDVNETRYKIFMKKYTLKNKLFDLSILPPCKSSLMLCIKQENYVAKLWKGALLNLFDQQISLDMVEISVD